MNIVVIGGTGLIGTAGIHQRMSIASTKDQREQNRIYDYHASGTGFGWF